MIAMEELINYPTIGPIRGVQQSPNVTQFLGVQYATLKDRFARGELLRDYPSKSSRPMDATKFGYEVQSYKR